MLEGLVGFMVGAWLFTVGGVGYALWRYVYCPWKVVRLDQAGLKAMIEDQNSKLASAVELIKMRSAEFLSDEELAYRESRLRGRSAQRMSR